MYIYIPKEVSLSAWEVHHTHAHTHVQLTVPERHVEAHVSGPGILRMKKRLLVKQSVGVTTSVGVVVDASSGRAAAPHVHDQGTVHRHLWGYGLDDLPPEAFQDHLSHAIDDRRRTLLPPVLAPLAALLRHGTFGKIGK